MLLCSSHRLYLMKFVDIVLSRQLFWDLKGFNSYYGVRIQCNFMIVDFLFFFIGTCGPGFIFGYVLISFEISNAQVDYEMALEYAMQSGVSEEPREDIYLNCLDGSYKFMDFQSPLFVFRFIP